MSASSLIFVVIFAVWAAYMLQHWVRRREDLATARSVDRFSEAMRVLERRSPVKADASPRPDATQRPGVLRPQITVKSARDTGDSNGASRITAGRAGQLTNPTLARAVSLAQRAPKLSLSSPEAKLGALAAACGFFLLTLVLAPFGVVPGWLPLLGLVAVGGVVAWLRRVALQNRAGHAQRPVRVRPSTGATAVPAATPAPTSTERPVVAAAEPKRSPLVAEHVETTNDAVFDQEPDMNAAAHAEAEVFDAGWAPVEVPRPTYTMKARAERPEVQPAATVAPVDTRPLAARYENTPVEELPFDGMVLDEDYEELPQVYRAG